MRQEETLLVRTRPSLDSAKATPKQHCHVAFSSFSTAIHMPASTKHFPRDATPASSAVKRCV